jgi:hypothetical protein
MGTLDTKGLEYSYLRNRLLADDLEVRRSALTQTLSLMQEIAETPSQ